MYLESKNGLNRTETQVCGTDLQIGFVMGDMLAKKLDKGNGRNTPIPVTLCKKNGYLNYRYQ